MSFPSRQAQAPRRNGMSARMLLLVLLVWSRLWAGVPEAVTHAEADPGHGVHQLIDHVTVVEHDREHTAKHVSSSGAEHGHEEPEALDAPAGTADEHHHHLHACGAGAAAVMPADIGIDLSMSSDPIAVAVSHQSDRLPERLLRPPAA